MKKLFSKDKNLRLVLKTLNKKYFILKSILNNRHLFELIRHKAFLKLKNLSGIGSVIATSDRCVESYNKKRFNKFTMFSRHIYLKLIRNGKISGFQKSSW